VAPATSIVPAMGPSSRRRPEETSPPAASIMRTRKEIVMPVIVVTRLRLRDPALLDEFFTDAVAAIEQAMKSAGNLGADALADADNAWWSVSAWHDRRQMQAYVDSQPHQGISTRLDHFCDEATFADWEQPSPDLPDWQTSWRHLTADGKTAELTHPSPANHTRDFPPPVEPPPSVS
jgi:hypothetical protein